MDMVYRGSCIYHVLPAVTVQRLACYPPGWSTAVWGRFRRVNEGWKIELEESVRRWCQKMRAWRSKAERVQEWRAQHCNTEDEDGRDRA